MTILERLSDSPDGRECRRCGASLEGAEVVGRVCLRCPECRYVTAFPPSSTTRLPLAYWAEQVPGTAPLLEDEPDPTRAAHVVGELIDTTLAFLAHWVDRSPGSAVHWLTTLLSRADDLSREGGEEASRDRSRPYRIAQLMYALILRHGPMDFGWSRSDEVTDYLNENGYALVSDLTILIDTLTRARRELNSMTVTGGELVLARSQEDWELVELVNNIASERSALKTVLARSELHDLQRRLFGTSFDEIFGMIDPAGRDTGLAGHQDGALITIDLARSTPESARMIGWLTLTAERLRRFQAPFFFDLGPVATEPAAGGAPSPWKAAEVVWLAYYPFLDAITARRPGTPLALSTTGLIEQLFATSDGSAAHLLVRTQAAACERDPEACEAVKRLARAFHTEFEEEAGEEFRRAGLVTRSGLSTLEGRRLPCGEIDLLAASRDGTVVVVGEAKNVDLPLQKDAGYANLSDTLRRARDQVARKAEWVRSAWGQVAAELDVPGESEPVVLGTIVTRRPVPPGMLGRWPGLQLAEIGGVVRQLLEQPPSGWRRDLARGIVGEEKRA